MSEDAFDNLARPTTIGSARTDGAEMEDLWSWLYRTVSVGAVAGGLVAFVNHFLRQLDFRPRFWVEIRGREGGYYDAIVDIWNRSPDPLHITKVEIINIGERNRSNTYGAIETIGKIPDFPKVIQPCATFAQSVPHIRLTKTITATGVAGKEIVLVAIAKQPVWFGFTFSRHHRKIFSRTVYLIRPIDERLIP